ncbi:MULTISPECIES: hypothetical protein [unclassified Wolbachia]|uniref:hypothetical protein n=1 Tax=unclassified Wolbachia TaxID=2640676 RepID=UPI000B02AD75|nr:MULTISPECIES: hypothetical protein [unclassified Wolbachia]
MLKHNVLDEITARLDSSVKHWNDIVYYVISCHIAMFVQLWNESRYDVELLSFRYLLAAEIPRRYDIGLC